MTEMRTYKYRIKDRGFARTLSAHAFQCNQNFTTQTYAGCGSIAGPKGQAGLNEREWICSGCGASHDRDVNSAVVILARALSAQGLVQESRMAA
jgi:transposase